MSSNINRAAGNDLAQEAETGSVEQDSDEGVPW
jgi:hypothetical protein